MKPCARTVQWAEQWARTQESPNRHHVLENKSLYTLLLASLGKQGPDCCPTLQGGPGGEPQAVTLWDTDVTSSFATELFFSFWLFSANYWKENYVPCILEAQKLELGRKRLMRTGDNYLYSYNQHITPRANSKIYRKHNNIFLVHSTHLYVTKGKKARNKGNKLIQLADVLVKSALLTQTSSSAGRESWRSISNLTILG